DLRREAVGGGKAIAHADARPANLGHARRLPPELPRVAPAPAAAVHVDARRRRRLRALSGQEEVERQVVPARTGEDDALAQLHGLREYKRRILLLCRGCRLWNGCRDHGCPPHSSALPPFERRRQAAAGGQCTIAPTS